MKQAHEGRLQFDLAHYPVAREMLRRATERHFRRRLEQYDQSVQQAALDAMDEGLRDERVSA